MIQRISDLIEFLEEVKEVRGNLALVFYSDKFDKYEYVHYVPSLMGIMNEKNRFIDYTDLVEKFKIEEDEINLNAVCINSGE